MKDNFAELSWKKMDLTEETPKSATATGWTALSYLLLTVSSLEIIVSVVTEPKYCEV